MYSSFLVFCLWALTACVNLHEASCKSSDTPAVVSAADIATPPSGLQKYYADTYTSTKYLPVNADGVQMYVFGTAGVSDWMMVQTEEMARNVTLSIASSSDRSKLSGHEFIVITDNDPEIPNSRPGQRNTGADVYTVINEVLVCATAVDTIRPDDPAEYRAWDTPIHEFGHSVERALGIKPITVALEKRRNPNYSDDVSDEYFAWATQNWFNANLQGRCGLGSIGSYEYSYLFSIYKTDSIWKPTCAGRPQ